MKTSALVLAAAAAVAALPVEKREVGGILMCTGPNQTGTCSYAVYALDQCHQLPDPYHRHIRTFVPDGDAFACYPRATNCNDICTSPTGCTFGAVDSTYPHRYDLAAIQWDTLFASFDCSSRRGS